MTVRRRRAPCSVCGLIVSYGPDGLAHFHRAGINRPCAGSQKPVNKPKTDAS